MSRHFEQLSDVRLTLRAALPTISVALGRFSDLRPGLVIRLDIAVRSNTELSINGMTLAEGEIVSAGDARAMRVETLR